MHYKYKQNIP